MFFNKKMKPTYQVPKIDFIKEDSFFDNIDKICNSFKKIYQSKQYIDGLLDKDGVEHYDYMDVIFEKCINFVIGIEKCKILNYTDNMKASWENYLNTQNKEKEK